jgi:hypothetical protein
MLCVRGNSWLLPNLLLVVLLIAAQSDALAHTFKRQADTLQPQTCAICVTASQLDLSCVDTPSNTDLVHCHSYQTNEHAIAVESIHALLARQRGPPNSL